MYQLGPRANEAKWKMKFHLQAITNQKTRKY